MENLKNIETLKNNVGIIGCGAVKHRYFEHIEKVLEEEMERKRLEVLMQDLPTVTQGSDILQSDLYRLMLQMVDVGRVAKELSDSFDEITKSIIKEPSIEQLKKQIKYSKNPLEVIMLNKQLNKLYKEMKRK